MASIKHRGGKKKETGQGASEKNYCERNGKREKKKTTEGQGVFTVKTVMRAGGQQSVPGAIALVALRELC